MPVYVNPLPRTQVEAELAEDVVAAAISFESTSLDAVSAQFTIDQQGAASGVLEAAATDGSVVTVRVSGTLDRVICDVANGVSSIEFENGLVVPCTQPIDG